MADVVVRAGFPSLRVGLIAMLTEGGHRVLPEEVAHPGVVWVIDQPDPDAIDRLIQDAEAESPRALVALTDDPGLAFRLAGARVRGWACLGRDADPVDLDLAVRAADAGLVLLDLPIAGASLTRPRARPDPSAELGEPLTARERQVLELVSRGLPNKGIARALGISENTAKFHLASLMTKLGAASRTEAVTIGARRGLIVL